MIPHNFSDQLKTLSGELALSGGGLGQKIFAMISSALIFRGSGAKTTGPSSWRGLGDSQRPGDLDLDRRWCDISNFALTYTSLAFAMSTVVSSPNFSASSMVKGLSRWHSSTYAGLIHSSTSYCLARRIVLTGVNPTSRLRRPSIAKSLNRSKSYRVATESSDTRRLLTVGCCVDRRLFFLRFWSQTWTQLDGNASSRLWGL